MFHRKSSKAQYILCISVILVTTITLWHATNYKDQEYINKHGSKYFLIPNIVHYILFNRNSINFITYLSILSVLKIQKPDTIFIHTDNTSFIGYYWDKIIKLRSNSTILLTYLPKPTHVYGQMLSSIYHSSDVARIHVLKEYGGIYLDTDVLVINNLDRLRLYETVVGWPDGDYMGSQVLLASKKSKFLTKWLEGYKRYHPRDWYFNAGVVPTEILQKYPYIAHYENTSLGVQNLLEELHSTNTWDWKQFYTIHLLSRHKPSPTNIDDISVKDVYSNFGDIVRWILQI